MGDTTLHCYYRCIIPEVDLPFYYTPKLPLPFLVLTVVISTDTIPNMYSHYHHYVLLLLSVISICVHLPLFLEANLLTIL